MVLEVELGVLAPLADALLPVRVPGARFLDDPRLGRDVHEERLVADPLVEHEVELGLAERRRHLVLHHFHAYMIADHHVTLLHRADAPHVQPYRRVELERAPAAGRLGIAEHDPDLLAELIDENHGRARAVDGTRELAERLAHQPRLQTRQGVSHLALDLGLGDERRHRVDHDHVHGAGAHQDLRDLERLLAGIGLRDEEIVDVHAQLLRVLDVEGVLRVDVGRRAPEPLRIRHHVKRQRGLAARFRAEDLGHPAPGNAAHADGGVQVDGTRADRVHSDPG